MDEVVIGQHIKRVSVKGLDILPPSDHNDTSNLL